MIRKKVIAISIVLTFLISMMPFPSVYANSDIFDVSTYGAVPNDETDDGNAIRSAIAAAIANGGGTVKLYSGKYIVSPAYGTQVGFVISNANSITIEGNGADIELTDNFSGGFLFESSENITVSGLKFNYKEKAWVQGHVTAIDKANSTFDYELIYGFSSMMDDPRFAHGLADSSTFGFGMVRDRNNPFLCKMEANDFFRISAAVKLSDMNWRFTMQSGYTMMLDRKAGLEVGDPVTFNNRGNVGTLLRFIECKNITVVECEAKATVGTFVTSYLSVGPLSFDKIKISRDTNAWISSNADAFHMQSTRGAITISNSVIEGLSDDVINIYQPSISIVSINTDTSITVKGISRNLPKVGDTITVFAVDSGKIRNKSRVLHTQVSGSNTILQLEQSIPEMLTSDILFCDGYSAKGSQIINNTFNDIRGNGVIARADDIIISGNRMKNLNGGAVKAYNDAPGSAYNEGLSANGITVSNNVIENVCFVNQYKNIAPIYLFAAKKGGGLAESKTHENIVIENNTIIGSAKYGIYAACAENIIISNNSITTVNSPLLPIERVSIYLQNVNNGKIINNTITDTLPNVKSGIDTSLVNSNIIVQDNMIYLADGVPAKVGSFMSADVSDRQVILTVPDEVSGVVTMTVLHAIDDRGSLNNENIKNKAIYVYQSTESQLPPYIFKMPISALPGRYTISLNNGDAQPMELTFNYLSNRIIELSKFLDGNNNEIDAIQTGPIISKITIHNYAENSKLTLIIGVYNNGRLVDSDTDSGIVDSTGTLSLEASVNLADITGINIRAMIWDGLDLMVPLSSVKTI